MTFEDIINDVDEFFPNAFSFEEKMKFANNLSSILNKRFIKHIKTAEVAGGENFSLPAGITPDLIVDIYFDGVRQRGVSAMSILSDTAGHSVRIDYIDVPVYQSYDELPVSAPFDNLYLYYILAFICFHMNDIDGYNSNMAIYSTYLRDFEQAVSKIEGENLRFKNL